MAFLDTFALCGAVSTYGDAMKPWHRLDSLADLATGGLMTVMLIGLTIMALSMTSFVILAIMGRDVLIGRPGILRLGMGIPGIFLSKDYDVRKIANLRISRFNKEGNKTWRGHHLSFDYGDRQIDFDQTFGVLGHGGP